MKIIAFGGPSLDDSITAFDTSITWLPPAGQGDVLSAVHRMAPDVAVIVDTLTWPDVSVWHKEIIWALSRGVRVVGTAAGGALRAAELSFCGMKGSGRVFDAVTVGEIEDDADVYCSWEFTGPGFRRMTIPLVNLKATIEAVKEKNPMVFGYGTAMLNAARGIYYEERTSEALLEALKNSDGIGEAAESILACVQENYVDIQKQDVLETLARIREPGFLPEPLTPETMTIPYNEHGAIFRMLYDHDRIVENDGLSLRLYEIANFVTTKHPDIETLMYSSFNRELVLILAEYLGITVDESDRETECEAFRKKFGITSDDALVSWLKTNDMNQDDFNKLMQEEAVIRKLHASFLAGQMFQKNTRPLLNFMRRADHYSTWRAQAFDREKALAGSRDQLLNDYKTVEFGQLLLEKYAKDPLPWSNPIRPAADSLGIGAKELKIEILKDRLRERILLEKIENSLI